jgi:hypothetical protein
MRLEPVPLGNGRALVDSLVRPRMLLAIASSGATLVFVGKALIKSF